MTELNMLTFVTVSPELTLSHSLSCQQHKKKNDRKIGHQLTADFLATPGHVRNNKCIIV